MSDASATHPENRIDLDALLASKGYKLPSGIVNYLKRFLHLDFINRFLEKGYEGVEFFTKALEYFDINLQVEGLDAIPNDGTLYTFVANHPLGGADALALCSLVGGRFGEKVKSPMNDFLLGAPALRAIAIPVSKTGAQSHELPQLIDGMFASDNQVLMFPAGLCSRKIDGIIQDLPWKKTFISKSVAYSRSVVPVHFYGRNSARFYRIARLCSILKLKFNFAMAFLPDELCKAQHSTLRVVFGKPIPPSTFDSTKTAAQWAQWVRGEVYKL